MREWLKLLRKGAKLRQKEMAAALGISEPAYCLIEKGKRGLDVRKVIQIAKALKLDPATVLRMETDYLSLKH